MYQNNVIIVDHVEMEIDRVKKTNLKEKQIRQ